MRYIEEKDAEQIPGRPLSENEQFAFACHPGISCFNQCCRNLNLYLYPYDVIRLKNCLGISSGAFIDTYTHVVLREGSFFPHVLLAMAEDAEKTCPFLTDEGCRVYPDRPQTCRAFPVEQAVYFEEGKPRLLHYFRPPDFCRGREEACYWTVKSWEADQNAGFYNQMTVEWAEVLGLFPRDPWGAEGPYGQKAKMAFMAVYNVDDFRQFVLESSFFSRFKVKPDLRLKIKNDDVALFRLGLAWIKLMVFGIRTTQLSPKK
ncbi:MAG: YkgJ family cysteine cluster protein [Desulfobacterales bacterium]